MNISTWWRRVLGVITLVASVPAVLAQGGTQTTLEKIREYGTIYFGHREA